MRVLVCGGRDFDDFEAIENFLNEGHQVTPISLLIQGGQRGWSETKNEWVGADWLASEWARKYQVPFVNEPALWDKEGRAAGPLRNGRMLEKWTPDIVIAFPGGRGTLNMINQANAAGIQVIRA